jgi:hypothetical protein
MSGFAAMVLLSPSPEPTGRRGAIERADYLIDRFHVGYRFGGGWTCGCVDFAKTDACRHTREAAGRLAAQMRIIEHIKMGSLDPMRGAEARPPRIASRNATLR